MPYFHGWLQLVDPVTRTTHELLNHARTSAYLQSSAAVGCGRVSNILEDGGCAAYAYEPDCGAWAVDLPGTSGNYISTPDVAALDITGDITLIAHVAADDWSPSAEMSIIDKRVFSTQLSYGLALTTTGALRLYYSQDGTTNNAFTSSVDLSTLVSGAWKWVATTLDVDNGSAQRAGRFWTSDDGVTWTQLGTTQTVGPAISLFSSTAPLHVGAQSNGTSAMFAGKIQRAQVRSGIGAAGAVGGTVVADFIANGRTTYIDSTGKTWTVNGGSVAHVLEEIPSVASDLVWLPSNFTTPTADEAPWYSASRPESAEALGFWITEWTGLDSGHIVRGTQNLGTIKGGSQLGRLGAKGRTMAFNVILFGESEKALEYLFRWLDAALMNVCSTCSTNKMLIRRFCPEIDDSVDEGVAELREVGLVEGLKWLKPISERLGCFMRPAEFTLMAGDPCMYEPEVTGGGADVLVSNMNTCFSSVTHGTTRAQCRPSCSELTAGTACRTVFTVDVDGVGAIAPYMILSNPSSTDYTVPVRIQTRADPPGIGAGDPCGLPLLAELYVRALPPNSELVYDAAGRSVFYRDASTGAYVNGWPYVDVNSVGVPRFPALGCGTHHFIIEPSSLCFDGTSGAWTDVDGIDYGDGALPTALLYLQERLGCP